MYHKKTLSIALTVAILYLSGEALGQLQQRCGKSKTGTRIIGGENAYLHDWPWMVYLDIYFGSKSSAPYNCGGSLINNQWILTAAHCIAPIADGINVTSIMAFLGGSDVNNFEPRNQVPISNWYPHEKYDKSNVRNDIGLIKLDYPLDLNGAYSDLEPICLPPVGTPMNIRGMCVATGYGNIISDRSRALPSPTLRQVRLPISKSDTCINYKEYKDFDKFDQSTQVCVGNSQDGKGVCIGDSGGPLNCQLANGAWVVYGVSSYGTTNCTAGPTVYTNVGAYLPWIADTMAKNNYPNFQFPIPNPNFQYTIPNPNFQYTIPNPNSQFPMHNPNTDLTININ